MRHERCAWFLPVRQVALADELGVALSALRIHSEDQRVLLLRVGPAVTKITQLLAADSSVVAGIKNQHHVMATQGGE